MTLTTHSISSSRPLFDLPGERFDNITREPLKLREAGMAERNVENILRVADAIERRTIQSLGFNMRYYSADLSDPDLAEDRLIDHSGHNCGTVACIAGWAHALRTGGDPGEASLEEARDWLGVESNELFCPTQVDHADWANIPQEQAVRTLRHLAATGEVDWTVGAPSETAA